MHLSAELVRGETRAGCESVAVASLLSMALDDGARKDEHDGRKKDMANG